MSDAIWIALIVFGFLLIIFFSLLFFLPKTVERLLGRVQAFDANAEGLSIKFFEEQAHKVAELRGGETPKAPSGSDWKEVSVLWVDDVPENNFHEATMFEALGADVRFARDNAAALAAAQEKPPTLMISDIHRHGETETGLDLPAKFNEANQLLPTLIYYTGYRTEEKTANGHAVTTYPAELFSEVARSLEV